jgi:SAM-dependent methyltransferase
MKGDLARRDWPEGSPALDSKGAPAVLPPLRFSCPRCQTSLTLRQGALACVSCPASYPIVNGIPTFVEEQPYWGEIPEQDMAWLVAEVERGRPWRETILAAEQPSIREKTRFLLDTRRANWVLDLALPSGAEILDVGAGFGGVAAGLAPYAGRVVALEPVSLRARFAAARFAQDRDTQVQVVRGSAHALPFPPGSFDLVVLSGVLEWIGKGTSDPGSTQRAVLKRIHELLRPNGTLVIGIENRIGIWFFLGRQDHSYLPFTSLMPRWLASSVTRAFRGHPYDTLTYTHGGYRHLLQACGFGQLHTLLPIWSYNWPDYLVPLEAGPRADMLDLLIASGSREARWSWVRRLHCRLRLSRPLANDFILFARRAPEAIAGAGVNTGTEVDADGRADVGWLRRALLERWAAWGLGGHPDRLSFLIHNRSHPTIVVYAGGRYPGQVVLRLSPPGASFSPPRAEIEALRWIEPKLTGSLAGSVPRALDLLEQSVHEIGVTTYMPGRYPMLPAGPASSDRVREAAGATIAAALGWLEEFHRRTAPEAVSAGSDPELRGEELARWVTPGLQAALPDGAGLAARLTARLVPLGSLGRVPRPPQHGDFVLSNLRVDGDRSELGVRVIDWERFGRVPMPGFDAIHFVTYVALLLQPDPWRRLDARAVVRLLFEPGELGQALRAPLARYLAAQGLDPGLLRALLPAYFAAFISEYVIDRPRRGIVSAMGELLRASLAEPGLDGGGK